MSRMKVSIFLSDYFEEVSRRWGRVALIKDKFCHLGETVYSELAIAVRDFPVKIFI